LGKRPFGNRTTYDEFVNGGADGGGVPQTDLPLNLPPDSANNEVESENNVEANNK